MVGTVGGSLPGARGPEFETQLCCQLATEFLIAPFTSQALLRYL